MNMKKFIVVFFLLLVAASGAMAQVCPGPSVRTALLNLQKSNIVNGTRAYQIPMTDTCGNQRYVTIDSVITLICDDDWLDIGSNDCPDNINDSIYTQKYAAVGARLVWPTAELLVSDSVGVGLEVISGNRNARLGFYDNVNQYYGTIDQSGASTLWYFQPTGEMRFVTAGGGTVQSPGAPFVNQFSINPNASPLPTIQAYLYPNTRTDTNTVHNFMYTDGSGNFRSQAIDTLIRIVVDSISVDTSLQVNWYSRDDTTTALGRNAFIRRSAWWRGLDSIGFIRFTMRPDLFRGDQFTMFQDSLVMEFTSDLPIRNYITLADTGIIISTTGDAPRSVNIATDTVNWSSIVDPALQIQNLLADGTYFHADSTKVVALGQFPGFPSLNFDGTEKGFFYDPPNQEVYSISGDAQTGAYGYFKNKPTTQEQYVQYDISGSSYIVDFSFTDANYNYTEKTVSSNNGPYSEMQMILSSADPNSNRSLYGVTQLAGDSVQASLYLGECFVANNYYRGNRAFGVRTVPNDPFDWIQVLLYNDTTFNNISFYNRAYYWANEHPTGSVGDTLFHYWAEDGVNAGKHPGFIAMDDIVTADNGLSEVAQNHIQLGGALLKNTSITSNSNSTYRLTYTGISTFADGAQLDVITTGNVGMAVRGETTNGRGIFGTATTGVGVYAAASGAAGYGLYAWSSGGTGIYSRSDGSSNYILDGLHTSTTNTVTPSILLSRTTTGTAANGIGQSLQFLTQTTTGVSQYSNEIISRLTDATNASWTSQMEITGVSNTATNTIMLLEGNGDVSLSDGNFSLSTAGNKLNIATGANASAGTATLSSGTVTVNTTAVTANSLIFLTYDTPSGTQGFLSAPTGSVVAGTSFVINSSSGSDASTVYWWLIN